MIINRYLTYIIFVFFISIFVFAIWSDLHILTKNISNIKDVNIKLKKTLILGNLIQELQKERGLTNIYYVKKDTQTLELILKQRKKAQKVLLDIHDDALQKNIDFIHAQIETNSYTQNQVFNAYTKLIFGMLLETKKLLLFTNDEKIKNHFLIYQNSNLIREYLGQLRAKIGSILAAQKISQEKYIAVVGLERLVESYIMQTKENIQLTKANLKSPLQISCFVATKQIIHKVVLKNLDAINISPMQWFTLSTCAIDAIHISINNYIQGVKKEIATNLSQAQSKLYYHLLFWLFSAAISLIFTILLFRINKRMLAKQKLLEEYKKAIDSSTIVSKTNKHGIITYVNQAFCDISGYKEKELLGKPHSIVRHPDVDKKTFKEMWKTIQNGRTWTGQIVNLAKNQKTSYWVNAAISPIYDDENNLVEYIAIRHDITQIIELNKEIKNTQYELIYRMGESVESRSKESGHHIQRVAHYSKLLAHYYGLGNQEADTIFIASTMHDMGKIAIPDSILLKAGKLNNDEWEIMKTHSAIGHKILAGSNLPILKMAANIAYEHHEHYNGNGYPRGIKEDEISICARIVAIADVFDALISERVYKQAWPLQKVILLFQEESGKQFDPELTQLFLNHIDKFMKIKNQFED